MTAAPNRALAAIDRWRRLVVIVLHVALITASNYAAFWLRFDGEIPALETSLFRSTVLWLIAIRAVTFAPLKLYEGLWRYSGIWDLRNIIVGVLASSSGAYVLVHQYWGLTRYPRSVFIIDAVLLVCMMGGVRLTRRIVRELLPGRAGKRVLIFGAGDAGEMIVRDMRAAVLCDFQPVAFVDDDPRKVGQRIHGVPVLGTRADLGSIIRRTRPAEVLVATANGDPGTIRGIVSALEPFKLPIKTLPNLREILNGRVTVTQIRNLHIADLLTRAPVGLDSADLRRLIRGKRVLVTGAGGSIGSELCRQIATLEPSALILLDRYENGLHAVATALLDSGRDGVQPVIADVTDADRVRAVFTRFRPHIVFHAAAHKHVSLMEDNACEAVKNNVRGTRLVVEECLAQSVDRFILISTDKAVNPSSVMGATKRVAEFIVRAAQERGSTGFVTVRFGNVLGSNGSVLPRFLEQIRAGGPVTVTDQRAKRYFMLIPEAVQLVLHAASLATGDGGLYVLDMGEQISLLDFARNVIRLSGYIPDEEIPIAFVGLRPGEKLSEELIAPHEHVIPSSIDKLYRVASDGAEAQPGLPVLVRRLEQAALKNDHRAVMGHLAAIVPEFTADRADRESHRLAAPVA